MSSCLLSGEIPLKNSYTNIWTDNFKKQQLLIWIFPSNQQHLLVLCVRMWLNLIQQLQDEPWVKLITQHPSWAVLMMLRWCRLTAAGLWHCQWSWGGSQSHCPAAAVWWSCRKRKVPNCFLPQDPHWNLSVCLNLSLSLSLIVCQCLLPGPVLFNWWRTQRGRVGEWGC